ncbi:MAG: response regulator [Acidobacteriota bacterium]
MPGKKKSKNNNKTLTFSNLGIGASTILDSTNDAVLLMEGMNFIDCNKKAIELYGCSTKKQLISMKPYELSPEFQPCGSLSKDKALKKVNDALNGIPQFFEWKHTKYNKDPFDTEVSLNLIEKKGSKNLIAVVRDVTRRKKAEKVNEVLFNISKAAGESNTIEQLARLIRDEIGKLMDSTNFYIALVVNRAKSLYRIPYMFDENPEDMENFGHVIDLRGGFTDYVLKTEKPLLANKFRQEELMESSEIKLIGKDSESWLGVPLKVPGREIIGIVAVQSYLDPKAYSESDMEVLSIISSTIASAISQKRSEESVKESERRFRNLSDAAEEGIIFYDHKGIITDANRAFQQLTGFKFSSLFGKHITNFFHSDSLKTFRNKDKKLPCNLFEVKVLKKNSSPIYCISTIRRFNPSEGKVRVMTFNDISHLKKYEIEKKELQEKLIRSEKMEALGRLAGGVAHDLNNVLTAIVSYPELIKMHIDEKKLIKKYAAKMKDSGQKAAAIVEDLLTLARRGVTNFKIINLNSVIKNFIQSPQYEKAVKGCPEIEVKIDLAEDLLNMSGSKIHLDATIMNLFLNGVESMIKKGIIKISTKNIAGKEFQRGIISRKYICLSITDEGIGLSPKEQKKIFEPFYTKKIMGMSGTGLGMSVVWGTVNDHDGIINIESEKGRGTTFELFFPATDKELEAKNNEFPLKKYMGNREKILVVDDEDHPREIAAEFLTKLNFNVDKVSSGEEAVDLVQIKKYDLVVLDMLMDPGIDGLETFKELKKISPDIKAVIVSGFSETERVKRAQDLGAGEYIKKPYSLEEFIVSIKKELKR